MLQGPLEVNGGANGSQRWQSSGLQRRMAEACYKVTHASHVLDNTSLILGEKNKAVHVWFLPQTVLLRTVQMTLTFVHFSSWSDVNHWLLYVNQIDQLLPSLSKHYFLFMLQGVSKCGSVHIFLAYETSLVWSWEYTQIPCDPCD